MNTVNARLVVRRDTTANWNANLGFIPLRGEIIVYTDHGTVEDNQGNTVYVPGIKVGDGSAYLVDLPFVGGDVDGVIQELRTHTSNNDIHITSAERTFWNNKLNFSIYGGNLVFNRN